MLPQRSITAMLATLAICGVGRVVGVETEPTRSRAEWGAPAITVAETNGVWTITGTQRRVELRAADLALRVFSGATEWGMAPSSARDMRVRHGGVGAAEHLVRLADATTKRIEPYDTGFSAGVKLTLSGWLQDGAALSLDLFLTVALEGRDEELVCTVAADESRGTVVRQLDWPTALDASAIDHTLLPNARGNLLPRDWPKEFHPIRRVSEIGQAPSTDTSEVQSNIIECWSMAWWGFQKGEAAMMVIVETPDDAAYQFEHPAGGPTVIGPRWRAQLGRLGYPRGVRMCFVDHGNYVQLAQRYRRHVIDRGQFVSLREKIARTPAVASLIGTPLTRVGILRNFKPGSFRWDPNDPAKNHSLTTFDERAEQLRSYKARGVERLHVCLTGWPFLGYDRQHPDELPPPPQAGGYEGMKRLAETCRDLGYVLTLHDQFRDYYVDAPSYDPQFAIHEEDAAGAPVAFPGTRFGLTKEGRIPFMDHWDGGRQTFLNSRFMLGHLEKNYLGLAAHRVVPDGIYLDVFGYVPPDEDFNAAHPTTRTQALQDRADCYNWTRARLGIVGTEAACDWTIPYVDISSPIGPGRCVPVPLFNLVYHDAIITPYRATDRAGLLHGLLNGGLPQVFNFSEETLADLSGIHAMAALHERLALVAMTNHEFLDAARRRERSTFADGTTVTVDWDAQSYEIAPALE